MLSGFPYLSSHFDFDGSRHEILKRDAIQKLVANINEERAKGYGHIQNAYDESREQTKKAMRRAVDCTITLGAR